MYIDYIFKYQPQKASLNKDLIFYYDINEILSLIDSPNYYVLLVGETSLNKRQMLSFIFFELLNMGVVKDNLLFIDMCLPIFDEIDINKILEKFYSERQDEELYLIINEIYMVNEWGNFLLNLKDNYPNIKLIASSSVSYNIYSTVYDNIELYHFIKIIVLSRKNNSNKKHKSEGFGIFDVFKYNIKNNYIEIKGLTPEGKTKSELIIPDEINGLPVKIIASGAFHDRERLRKMYLPKSIKKIGDYAFSNCTNLLNITLPKALTYIGDNAFINNIKLSTIKGGENITHIGVCAFHNTLWLKSQNDKVVLGKVLYLYKGIDEFVTINTKIKTISYYAFSDTKIKTVKIKNPNIHIEEGAFFNCRKLIKLECVISALSVKSFTFFNCFNLKLHFKLKTAGNFSFFNNRSISELEFVNNSSIGDKAFANCTSLKEIKGDIKSIGIGAFANTTNLKKVSTNNTIYINKFAFFRSNINQLTLNKIKKIDDYAFLQNIKLTKIIITSNPMIGLHIFKHCPNVTEIYTPGRYTIKYLFQKYINCLTKITVHSLISDNFNRNNQYVTDLAIKNVTNFGSWAFYNNSNLQNVVIDSVDYIGHWAFTYSKRIKTVSIPDNTQFIGINAFRYCSNLIYLYINSSKLIDYGVNAFYGTSLKSIFIKSNLKNQYITNEKWKSYFNIFKELNK